MELNSADKQRATIAAKKKKNPLFGVLTDQMKERNYDMFCSYTGQKGGPSLKNLAVKHGVSRERVRQILYKELRYHLRSIGLIKKIWGQ